MNHDRRRLVAVARCRTCNLALGARGTALLTEARKLDAGASARCESCAGAVRGEVARTPEQARMFG